MARLKELKIWKGQGKTWIKLEFTAGAKADPVNFPDGVLFQKGYVSNVTAERKLAELREAFAGDLIAEEGTCRRLFHGKFQEKRESDFSDSL